jgi:hypothetical protein
MKTLLIAGTAVALLAAANLAPATAQATKPVSQVVQWNRTLLVIVRTAAIDEHRIVETTVKDCQLLETRLLDGDS